MCRDLGFAFCGDDPSLEGDSDGEEEGCRVDVVELGRDIDDLGRDESDTGFGGGFDFEDSPLGDSPRKDLRCLLAGRPSILEATRGTDGQVTKGKARLITLITLIRAINR